jgi:aryl-alcohol dehydrogenase-like predicted oxidoreductase
MQYRYLGKTGIQISRLAFGTMTFGGEADTNASAQLFQACLAAGINLFDCANSYHAGRAEEILGKLVKGMRQDVLLTSKVYFPVNKHINARGLSRLHIMQALEASLQRLGTDYLDIYFFHHFDTTTPLEESLRAADDLVRQGKVRYLGVSNFAAWQIMKGLGISAREHLASFACIQPMYNLLKRQAEVEILPMAQAENLGVISYNPLAGGILSGKYLHHNPQDSRLNINPTYQARYGEQSKQPVLQKFLDLASSYELDPVSLSIAWVMQHPAVTAPLLGARNVEQLTTCLAAAQMLIPPELYGQLCSLTPTPPLATDRNEEQ